MLKHRADLRPLAFNAIYFTLLALAFHPAFETWSVAALVLLVPLCVTAFQGAVQTHNAIHCPPFRRRFMNKLYQVVLTLIYGHPTSAFVPGHNLSHHKHTQSRRDVMRTTKARLPYHLLNVLFFFVIVAPGIMKGDSAYGKHMMGKHPKWFRQLALEFVALWGVTIALAVVDLEKAIVFWIVPHLYAQWGIVTMNMLQHDGCDVDSEWNHSRNFVSRSINWWTFNNGFHTIHHMHPGMHWSLLPEAHAREVAPHIHPNLDQASLIAYSFRTFVLSRRETYDGKPYRPVADGPDETWLPRPEETPDDLGAEAVAPHAA